MSSMRIFKPGEPIMMGRRGGMSISSGGSAPLTPSAPTGTGGSGNISVTWTSVAGADAYNLRYSSDNATWTEVDAVTSSYTDTAAKTTIAATGLVYYQIQAVKSGVKSGWSPSSTPVGVDILSLSPLAWLKADGLKFQDTGTVTPAVADGDPVGRVSDAGAAGQNAVQSVAGQRPLLKLAIQNGLPVLRADGTNDLLSILTISGMNALHNGTGCTVLFAGKKTGTDGTTTGLYGDNQGTGARTGCGAYMVSGAVNVLISNGSGGVVNKSATLAQGSPFALGWRYKTGASPAAFRMRVNGGADTTSAESLTPSAGNTADAFGLFSLSGSVVFPFAGDGYEFLAVPSDVSDAIMAALFSYINIRWGLY